MRKRSNGSDWYREKKNRIRRGYGDTKKGMSEDKVDGNLDQWVQCDNCQKWRKVHSSTDISSLPKKWFCRLNIDSNHNSCDVPEEEEDDNNEDEDDDDGSKIDDDDDDGSNNDDDKHDDDDNIDDDEEEKEKEKEKKIVKKNGDGSNNDDDNDDDEIGRAHV